jgi:signal peptide peptidase SppA
MNPFLARFANEPSLIQPGAESRFQAMLNAVALDPRLEQAESEIRADENFWGEPGSFKAMLRPYVVLNGILQIPVRGVLLHDFPYAFFGLATGYEYIGQAFKRGMADPMVRGIALIIDSPGGMVAGCFDLVDEMYSERGNKPVQAMAAESAYSAAYAIFSVADKGIVSRTGGVGSIGVVTAHVDYSKALDHEGVKVTFIYAGDHKVDGNPYEPLPADVKARIQERIDELYAIFVSSVARNRGLDEQAVRDTEALCFTASQAVSNGLADEIGKLDDALAAFAADLSEPSGDEEMSTQDKPAFAQADIDDAVAAANATAATAQAAAVADARTAERTRIAAIIGSDEATGREDLANHLALETDTAADAAVAILAKSPKAAAEKKPGGLDAAMTETGGGADVGAGGGGGDSDKEDASGEATIALARQAGLSAVRRPAAQTH